MIKLVIAVGLIGATLCKPGYYKENEDFKYSRKSTDEGSKAGFYAAQRGNTGGNYEKAHNMDIPAQNQMSDIINKLDTTFDMKNAERASKGSVYGASSSMGTYGSNNYQGSAIADRNFQEGTRYDSLGQPINYDSQTLEQEADLESKGYHGISQTNAAYQNQHRYGSQSSYNQDVERFGDYNSGRQMQHIRPIKVVARKDTPVSIPFTSQAYEKHAAAYDEHSQQHLSSDFEVEKQRNLDALSHLTTDHKVYIPAGNINNDENFKKNKEYESAYSYKKEWERHDANAIPVVTSEPYNVISQAVNNYDFNAKNPQGDRIISGVEPSGEANFESRGYESSSRNDYRKEWVKNGNTNRANVLPLARPTSKNINNAYTNLNNLDLQNERYTGSNARVSTVPYSSVSQTKGFKAGYGYNKEWENQGTVGDTVLPNSGVVGSELSDLNSQRLTSNEYNRDAGNAYRNVHSAQNGQYLQSADQQTSSLYGNRQSQPLLAPNKPKEFQSSYSYHKSWERQGDPYVIQPIAPTTGYSNQKSAAYANLHGLEDCDYTQQRKVRSVNIYNHQNPDQEASIQENKQSKEELNQFIQQAWDDTNYFNQKQIDKIGQTTQRIWDDWESQYQDALDLKSTNFLESDQQLINQDIDEKNEGTSKPEADSILVRRPDIFEHRGDLSQLDNHSNNNLGTFPATRTRGQNENVRSSLTRPKQRELTGKRHLDQPKNYGDLSFRLGNHKQFIRDNEEQAHLPQQTEQFGQETLSFNKEYLGQEILPMSEEKFPITQTFNNNHFNDNKQSGDFIGQFQLLDEIRFNNRQPIEKGRGQTNLQNQDFDDHEILEIHVNSNKVTNRNQNHLTGNTVDKNLRNINAIETNKSPHDKVTNIPINKPKSHNEIESLSLTKPEYHEITTKNPKSFNAQTRMHEQELTYLGQQTENLGQDSIPLDKETFSQNVLPLDQGRFSLTQETSLLDQNFNENYYNSQVQNKETIQKPDGQSRWDFESQQHINEFDTPSLTLDPQSQTQLTYNTKPVGIPLSNQRDRTGIIDPIHDSSEQILHQEDIIQQQNQVISQLNNKQVMPIAAISPQREQINDYDGLQMEYRENMIHDQGLNKANKSLETEQTIKPGFWKTMGGKIKSWFTKS